MPGRRARGPVNDIPYGRRGVAPAFVAKVESSDLQARNAILDQELAEAKKNTDKSTLSRRAEQRKNEQHQADFDEVRRYFLLKCRDKEQKIRFYQGKLKEARQEREDLLAKFHADFDQLSQAHKLELTQLANTLKASKQRRDALATVAALEIQLRREIEEAEQTLKRERAQQSQQLSSALADYYMLHVRHEKELADGVEREKAKNRKMTADHLEHTVIEMMRDIDSEIKRLSALVMEARRVADVNSQLMNLNKQKYMERDLLQRECDATIAKINKNDLKIRKLVEELKIQDQKLSSPEGEAPEAIPEEVEEQPTSQEPKDPDPEQPPEAPAPVVDGIDREIILQHFFETAVDVLCSAVVKILGMIDPGHAEDYEGFHKVFGSFEGRKKELRFLMSKLGNLSFQAEDELRAPTVGFADIEGVDQEVAAKRIVEPQKKAFLAFSEPIASDELPELIATHFFQ
jgi:chromosome segregation ATPase